MIFRLSFGVLFFLSLVFLLFLSLLSSVYFPVQFIVIVKDLGFFHVVELFEIGEREKKYCRQSISIARASDYHSASQQKECE